AKCGPSSASTGTPPASASLVAGCGENEGSGTAAADAGLGCVCAAAPGAVRGGDLQDAKAATARPALIPAHPDRPPRRMRAAYHIPRRWTSGPALAELDAGEAPTPTDDT